MPCSSILRAAALTVVLLAAVFIGGCSSKYLYPGSSFDRDEEWETKWAEKDPAEKDMPQHLGEKNLAVDQNWDQLFPGSQDDD